MSNIQHYDIAIIGSGITGLSTAHHLTQSQELRVCISEVNETKSTSRSSANMISGGLIDNYTRIAQRHGPERAKECWAYANHAFDSLLAFAKKSGLAVEQGSRVRLIETEDEFVECTKAVEQLRAGGFSSEITKDLPPGGAALLGQQIDGSRAAVLDAQKLLDALSASIPQVKRLGGMLSYKRTSQHFEIETESGAITAEIIVLANHLDIPKFLPGLEAVLVSSQDQWLKMETDGKVLPFPVGSAVTWRHGHFWASVESPTRLSMGGARFLRPLAGFEAKAPELSEKVSKMLPEAWKKYFPDTPLVKLIDQRAALDARPCDEIPVIGPMFGETGIFVAAGYMGQGLSLGFKAGESLAKIVLGKSDELPRFFWPERHRSLAADTN